MIQYLNLIRENPFLNNIPTKVLLEGLLHARIKRLKTGSVLYYEGDKDDVNIYFIAAGALRGYFHKDDKEINSMFYIKNELISNIYAVFSIQTNTLTIEAAMPTTLIYISKDYMFKELKKYPNLYLILAQVLTAAVYDYEKRLRFLLCYPAKERYIKFIEHFGKFVSHFQAKDIASYLAITPETLSRIRKEIANNNKEV